MAEKKTEKKVKKASGKKRGPEHLYVQKNLERLVVKCNRWVEKFTRWGVDNAPSLVAEAAKKLDHARVALSKLPDDFVPPRAVAGVPAIEAGDRVAVREARQASYEGILSKEEMEYLNVIAVNDGRVRVKNEDGEIVVLARRDLVRVSKVDLGDEEEAA